MPVQQAGQPYTLKGTPLLGFSHQNTGDLKPGEKAVSNFDYDPASFPNGTVFHEEWPTRFTGGVRGWSSIQWNRYYGSGTTPSAPVPSVRLTDIKALTMDYNATISGDGNMLLDWFLTAKPNDMSTVVAEFEVLPNPSASGAWWANKISGAIPVGIIGPWTVTRRQSGSATIFFFVPTNGVRNKGQIDLRASMLWAAEKTKLINGEHYLNGLGFGIEPVAGKSSMTIRDMLVTYARK